MHVITPKPLSKGSKRDVQRLHLHSRSSLHKVSIQFLNPPRITVHKLLHYFAIAQEKRHSESDKIPTGRTGSLSIHEIKLEWKRNLQFQEIQHKQITEQIQIINNEHKIFMNFD